jgi:hypothetical protein
LPVANTGTSILLTREEILLDTHNNKITMGRSKQAPKRRRIDDEQAEKKAIQALLDVPQEQIEAAAAEATRSDIQDWPKVSFSDPKFEVPDWVTGLGISHSLPESHFKALKGLHETIKEQSSTAWTSWSGSPTDPRKRAFGFLPDTLGYQETTRSFLDISTPWKPEDEIAERQRNNRAAVVLKDIPTGAKDAIDYLCNYFGEQISDSSIKPYLSYSNLIAAQPNLHCGRHLLPAHVDHPLKDGFGVIIVTVGMAESGTVFIRDSTNTKGITMEVCEGQAYMLSDKARDSSAHGILAHKDGDNQSNRESLNLRFGLHDFTKTSSSQSLTKIPAHQVLQYWEADAAENTKEDNDRVPKV